MALQYIIDGYNVIKHADFSPGSCCKDPRIALLYQIEQNKLCGSINNTAIVVYDGYPDNPGVKDASSRVKVVFSCGESADERIRKILMESDNPKTAVVVSQDKEIIFFARSLGAQVRPVPEFLGIISTAKAANKRAENKHDLNYTQMERINRELKDKWLK